ncbi:MAG: hypothetical protein ACLTR8_12540 [Oscillospiraceae bacterium]
MGHNYNDSINFSFKKDLETIKSLPKEKRWKYIWDYYKIIILVLPVALIVLLILGSFCVNMVKGTFFPKDPVSIGIAVSGCSASPDWLQSCEEAIGCDPKREYLQILESPPYSTERDDFVIKSTLWLTAGQPDIFIVDEDGYEYLLSLDILVDLSRDWPAELQALSAGYPVTEYAVEISGTAFAREHGISDEPVYLCMFANGHGYQRGLDIAVYILENGWQPVTPYTGSLAKIRPEKGRTVPGDSENLRVFYYGNTAQLRLRVSAVFLLHFRSSENGKYIQYSSIFGTLNWGKNPA